MAELLDIKNSGEIDFTTRRGFDRLTPDTMGIPSYDEATRTFSLAVKSGETYFQFWSDFKRYEKTTTESETWDNVTGTYYIYFDTSGEIQSILSTSLTETIFLKCAICGLVYWNAVSGKAIVQAVDEQHGILMDASSHFNLHMTRGLKWAHGGLITGLADASDIYANIGVSLHFDEDIPISNSVIASTPFMYREGAAGGWVETAADLKIGHIVSGDTYISYNREVTGVWELVESSSSTDYIIYFMIKTNDANNPYKKIIGQTTYASRNTARAGLSNDLKAVHLSGMPSTECEFQFAWIAKRNGDLEDDGSGNAYVDLRGININSLN